MAVLQNSSKLKRSSEESKVTSKSKKFKKTKVRPRNEEEIYSDSDIEEDAQETFDHSESEDETAQEKKMRLTKKYLEELKQFQDSQNSDDDGGAVGRILKEDVLERAGKLQRKIADNCCEPNVKDIHVLKGHRNSVLCLAISSDGKLLFTGSKDCAIMKWCLTNFKRLAVVKGGKKIKQGFHKSHVTCLSLSSNLKYLASGGLDKSIFIWNPRSLSHLKTFTGHRNSITGLSFRVNSNQLFSTSSDRTVKVWDLEVMSYVETLYGHQDAVQACDSFNKERCLTAGGRDGSLRIWKIVEESQLLYHGHTGSIDCVRFINEEYMISGSDDGSVCLWSIMRKRPIVTVRDPHKQEDETSSKENWITAVAALHNSDLVATGSCDGYVRVWKCGEKFLNLTALFAIPVPGFINDLRFTNNGATLVAAVGQEHKLGRWWTFKGVKNSVWIMNLQSST